MYWIESSVKREIGVSEVVTDISALCDMSENSE